MSIIQRIAHAIWPPIAPIPRTDAVLTGYYGGDDAQVAETADHTSVLWIWEIGPDAEAGAFARIAAAKKRVVLDLTAYMFWAIGDGRFVLRADAEPMLLGLRDRLRDVGILRNILAVAPIDEPDIHVTPEDQHAANMIAKRVFDGVQLAVIFADFERLTHIEDYDLVGADAYDKRERIFDVTLRPWPPRSDYDRLANRLRPEQRIILPVGGGDPWRQDPAPFMAKAGEDGRVAMVLGFLYVDRTDCVPPAPGIRSNGMAEAYRSSFVTALSQTS